MGTIVQGVDKVRLAGGAYTDFYSGVRMYSRASLTKPFKVRCTFTRKVIAPVTTAEGAFHLFGWVIATSEAPGAIPANWPAGTTTRDTEVQNFLKGFRFSPGNINTVSPEFSNKFRMQTYNGDGTRTQYTSDVPVDLGLNVAQELELAVAGSTATLTAVSLGISVSHTSAIIGGMTTGFLMLYTSYGADAEWGNFRRIS
jgi:hypothetical protein